MSDSNNSLALNDVGPAPNRYETNEGTYWSFVCNLGDEWHYWTTI